MSNKLIPLSSAREIIAVAASWPKLQGCSPLCGSPKLRHPRQMRETSRPVLPSFVYSKSASSNWLVRSSGLRYHLHKLATLLATCRNPQSFATNENLRGGGGPLVAALLTARAWLCKGPAAVEQVLAFAHSSVRGPGTTGVTEVRRRSATFTTAGRGNLALDTGRRRCKHAAGELYHSSIRRYVTDVRGFCHPFTTKTKTSASENYLPLLSKRDIPDCPLQCSNRALCQSKRLSAP